MKRNQLLISVFFVWTLFFSAMTIESSETAESISQSVTVHIIQELHKESSSFVVEEQQSDFGSKSLTTLRDTTSVAESLQIYEEKLKVYFNVQKVIYLTHKSRPQELRSVFQVYWNETTFPNASILS